MITEKVKKELKEFFGYEIESENPLVLKGGDFEERLVGLVAEITLNEAIETINTENEENEESINLDDLGNMNDDDMLLVTGSFNYADEFDLSEWTTMSVGDFKELVEKLKAQEDEFEWYFGTNEELRFDDGGDLLNQLSIEKITQEQADVLDKLFGGSFDGGSGVFDRIWELGDEDDNDDDDDDNDSIFDKSDLRHIEFLKSLGWSVDVHDKDNYTLAITSPQGELSIASFSILFELSDYLKKNK